MQYASRASGVVGNRADAMPGAMTTNGLMAQSLRECRVHRLATPRQIQVHNDALIWALPQADQTTAVGTAADRADQAAADGEEIW